MKHVGIIDDQGISYYCGTVDDTHYRVFNGQWDFNINDKPKFKIIIPEMKKINWRDGCTIIEEVHAALKKTIDKVSQNSSALSLFNGRRVNNYLLEQNIKLSPKQLSDIIIQATNNNHPMPNSIEKLLTALKKNSTFMKHLNEQVTSINEFQLRNICSHDNIPYPKAYTWDFVLNYIFKYHAEHVFHTTKEEYTNSIQKIEKSEPKKEKTMIKTKTIHTVNDVDVTKLSADQLIEYVVELEEDMKKLMNVETKSTFITKRLAEMGKTLKEVVKHLDSK